MFQNKKRLKEIEQKLDEIKTEKEQLLKIKELLEETSPKIDITDVYAFKLDEVYSIVKLHEQNITGVDHWGFNAKGYSSSLIDVFNDSLVFHRDYMVRIERKIYLRENSEYNRHDTGIYAYLTPICEVAPELLAYPDKQVPLFVLQQVYYKLNKVDLSAPILRKNNH